MRAALLLILNVWAGRTIAYAAVRDGMGHSSLLGFG